MGMSSLYCITLRKEDGSVSPTDKNVLVQTKAKHCVNTFAKALKTFLQSITKRVLPRPATKMALGESNIQ